LGTDLLRRHSPPAIVEETHMTRTWIQSAESVTSGHADKLCDLLSDSVLDAVLEHDRFARVSCEVMVTTGMVIVTGQITTKCYVDITAVVREAIRKVGYNDPTTGFDHNSCAVIVMLGEQTHDVSLGVDRKGAGDQGVCVGYATNEGDGLPIDTHHMPVPTFLANVLTHRLEDVRKAGRLPQLHPDGKVQVSVEYRNHKPRALTHVILSAHHHADADLVKLRRDLKRLVIKPALDPSGLLTQDTQVMINPVGSFTEGGPRADAGLTGRKITVDCYGPSCGHGGSAFSGKDPTKPDRSGSYGARWAARNLVAAGLADRCSVEIAYVLGHSQPLSVTVDTFGTGKLGDDRLATILQEEFDFSPAGIIEDLDLRRPIYTPTAAFGHFGRPDQDFSWERLDRVDRLRPHLKSARKGGK